MDQSLRDAGRIFTDAAAYADPDSWHEVAAMLRRECPVLRVERDDGEPFWALTRHADVMTVERNAGLFTNEEGSTLMPYRPDPGETAAVKTLINMDGDEHRDHRTLVNEWFKPGAVRYLEQAVLDRAHQAVDDMAALGGECDFARDVALNYPLRVILSILGLPESDFGRMLQLTQELFGSEDPDFARDSGSDESDRERQMAVVMDFIAYFTELTAQRRAHPTDDLASVVANGRINGEPLSDLSTFGYYLIVATAGHDTTSNAVAGGMHAFLEHSDQLARLQADPSLIGTAAEEIVRWVSPVKHFMRTAQDDTVIGDQAIAKGDWIMMSFQSANRDEEVFTDPFRFDIARADASQSLGFGFGRHYCLGVHLAKLEIRAFFAELLRRLDHIEAAGPVAYMHATLVSGPKRLPVRYSMR
jgi:cytochrome P450